LPSQPPAFPVGRARITHYGNERVVIRARSATPAVVVLDDTWFPGWHATIDGRPATIERVDYFMRGVRIEPGTHTVDMRYAPASWRIGWIVSLLALLGWLALLGYGLKLHTRIARARYSRRSYGRSQTSSGATSRQRMRLPWRTSARTSSKRP